MYPVCWVLTVSQQTIDVEPMLVDKCWASVEDGSPILIQRVCCDSSGHFVGQSCIFVVAITPPQTPVFNTDGFFYGTIVPPEIKIWKYFQKFWQVDGTFY